MLLLYLKSFVIFLSTLKIYHMWKKNAIFLGNIFPIPFRWEGKLLFTVVKWLLWRGSAHGSPFRGAGKNL